MWDVKQLKQDSLYSTQACRFTLTMWDVKKQIAILNIRDDISFTLTMWDVKIEDLAKEWGVNFGFTLTMWDVK